MLNGRVYEHLTGVFYEHLTGVLYIYWINISIWAEGAMQQSHLNLRQNGLYKTVLELKHPLCN